MVFSSARRSSSWVSHVKSQLLPVTLFQGHVLLPTRPISGRFKKYQGNMIMIMMMMMMMMMMIIIIIIIIIMTIYVKTGKRNLKFTPTTPTLSPSFKGRKQSILLFLTLSCRSQGMPINMDILFEMYMLFLSLRPLYHGL